MDAPRQHSQSQREDMAAFFDARASGYEAHMRASVDSFDALYQSVAAALPSQPSDPEILDLGIGTGLEIEPIFCRFPAARITGVDLSSGMLSTLRAKPWIRGRTLTLIHGSFLERDLGVRRYDAVVSVMALHHWGPTVKAGLYRRVFLALRTGGVFVNGDYVVSQRSDEVDIHDPSVHALADQPHQLHLDYPMSPEREVSLLRNAGFLWPDILFRTSNACVFRGSVGRSGPASTAAPR